MYLELFFEKCTSPVYWGEHHWNHPSVTRWHPLRHLYWCFQPMTECGRDTKAGSLQGGMSGVSDTVSDFGSDSLLPCQIFLKLHCSLRPFSLPPCLPPSLLSFHPFPLHRGQAWILFFSSPSLPTAPFLFSHRDVSPYKLLTHLIQSCSLLLRVPGLVHKNSVCLGSKKIFLNEEGEGM